MDQGAEALTYTEDNVNPLLWLALNDEEIEVRRQYYDALINYNDEQLSKFLLGQRPLGEWDAFQRELREMHVDELIAVFDSAYRRATGG